MRVGSVVCRAVAALGCLIAAGSAVAQSERFLRAVEHDDGLRSTLETAIRCYQPADGDGPTIFLAAAVHIGDLDFYEALQTFLDAQDVVLFEGVGGPGSGNDPRWSASMDDAYLASVTTSRAWFLATLIDEHRDAHGEYPATLVDLFNAADESQIAFVERSITDAWGRPFVYGVVEGEDGHVPYVMSLGADGKVGGAGHDADITVSTRYPASTRDPVDVGDGIQLRLAAALGLEFQLAVMDHSRSNWRNSDMSVEQLMAAMGTGGATGQGDAMLDMMSGRGFLGRTAGVLLSIVGANPRFREVTKAMLVTMLVQADEILESHAAATGGMGAFIEVILHDRNEVVIADIKRVLADEPHVRNLAVIYGAGHLPGIEAAILEQMGYRDCGARWLPAIRADLARAGMSSAEARAMRAMIQRSLDRQLGRTPPPTRQRRQGR